MPDAATQRLVDQIVQELVQSGAMFTAYDVTLAARRRGGDVRHGDVRDLVHELFEHGRMGAAYTRSLVNVNAPTQPFLYHRRSDNPADYKVTQLDPVPPTPTPATSGGGFIGKILGKLFGGKPAKLSPASLDRPPQRSSSTPAPPRRGPATLGLDASNFLPISRDELAKAAKGVNLWNTPWFGRRDKIPPAEDERTKLIDRALVTHGLLSPEQLAEIHHVGAEMDRLRPDPVTAQHLAGLAGEAAVKADRERRAKLKEQKKAEAAEKRKRHAEGVARRKATDILFLGRGVSGRLGQRQTNPQKLAELGLPILGTPLELAASLGLTIPQLRWLAFHTEVATRTHYVTFAVPKRGGGLRMLSAPHRKLATAQRWVLDNILNKLPVETAAHGFTAGRSILTNARQHVKRAVLVNMDLEAFFPTITFPRVRSVFQRLGYSPAVATILALLCTECPRRQVQYDGKTYFVATGPRALPQGACTSPALSNQVARRLDKRLGGVAAKLGLSYTRYADDLTFSGDAALNDKVGYLMARVRHLAEEEGFAVNEKKSRVLRRNAAQLVTGLVVNDRPGVPRAEVRRLRAILHRAAKEGLEAQNRDGRPHFVPWLRGKIAYVRMSRPEVGDRLLAELVRVMG